MDLKIRDGDDYLLYGQLNQIGKLNYAIVAYENGIPIGCCALRNYDKDTMEIKRMLVRPANRIHGVASAILQDLEKWCIELGFKNCILETGINQPEAIKFYRKNKYESIPNYGPYMNSNYSVCLKKELVEVTKQTAGNMGL